MGLVLDIESRLKKNNIASSRVNAEIILSAVLGCDRIGLYTQEIALNSNESKALEDIIARRINGEPLQHIIGKTHFYGNELFIEKGVFIPRPETEILVETVIDMVNYPRQKTWRVSAMILGGGLRHDTWRRSATTCSGSSQLILDLCTGSGNIAISLTKALSHCKIIASDISDKALELARRNALLNKVSERIEFVKADLFDMPYGAEKGFDIIVSNPPYIPCGMIQRLPADVKKDPVEALDGGKDGMSFYSRIIESAPRFLKKGRIIALELADGACEKVRKLFELKGFKDIRIFKDLNGIERVITGIRHKV